MVPAAYLCRTTEANQEDPRFLILPVDRCRAATLGSTFKAYTDGSLRVKLTAARMQE